MDFFPTVWYNKKIYEMFLIREVTHFENRYSGCPLR